MTAHNETRVRRADDEYEAAVASQAANWIDVGVCHVWLFPCPVCKYPVLSAMWEGKVPCESCGETDLTPAAVLGSIPWQEALRAISEISGMWKVTAP